MLLQVSLSVVFSQILGMLWYSPALFGSVWMRGLKRNVTKEETLPALCLSFISGTLLQLLMYTALITYLGVNDPAQAMQIAVFLSAFITLSQVPHMAFSQQPIGMFLVDHGYDTAVLVGGAAIMTYL